MHLPRVRYLNFSKLFDSLSSSPQLVSQSPTPRTKISQARNLFFKVRYLTLHTPTSLPPSKPFNFETLMKNRIHLCYNINPSLPLNSHKLSLYPTPPNHISFSLPNESDPFSTPTNQPYSSQCFKPSKWYSYTAYLVQPTKKLDTSST
jgi:hypothetical protein